jgi:PAS domain S-box-containing protein
MAEVGDPTVGAALGEAPSERERRLEEALRSAEQRFAGAFHGNAAGMAISRLSDGVYLDVNDTFARMCGYERDELVGAPAVVVWKDPEARYAMVRDLEKKGRVVGRAFRIFRKNGEEWFGLVSAQVGLLVGERVVISSVLDVTERLRAEEALRAANEQLRESDRRKDEFLGMLSHELRNPLAPIRNALFILDRADPHGAQARHANEVATRQMAHLTRLVDDLLDVTRIARGKVELRRAALDVGALARRTAEDHRPLLRERGVELVVEGPDDSLPVHGDETRLAQVLGNLLHNAAKFTPAGGRVTISVAEEGGQAVIHVRDTGAGIDPSMLGAIFEPFTQAKQTLARSEGGLGLGLALVKGLVALHGGSVSATSGGFGRGADFAVALPLAPRSAAAPRVIPERHAAAHAGARRVLVIDDNRDAADSLAELAVMLGHEADVAYDAYEGLSKASEALPDVVLCDLGLPGMDGYEFARQLRALDRRHDVQLVAVSGYAQPEDVTRAAEAGFDAHVAKPADPRRIEELLAA